MPVLLALAAALLLPWSTAQGAAPAVKVGVIVSRTGEARTAGAAQSLAATGWADFARAGRGLVTATSVEVVDDAGSPTRAAELARDLADDGAWALVCCTTPAATAAVRDVAEELGLLLLALSDPAPLELATRGPSYWTFGLWPSEADALAAVVADALAEGRGTFALMTTADGYGEAVASTLGSLLGYAGMRLVHEERFATGTDELRPEALVVATNQPGAVAVWAPGPDTAVAVAALRARGYEGLVYARSALVAPGGPRLTAATYEDVRFAVPPAYVADDLPASHACSAEVAGVAERVAQLYGGVADLPAAAGVVDALDLIAAALEQLYVLQVPLDSPLPVLRQALRDAAVGLPPRCGGSGALDLQEGRPSAVVPGSLVAAEVGPRGDLRLP
ncbi:MAG TPA: ABC transporter substrate-binding protein [Trueperaceae bacterium]